MSINSINPAQSLRTPVSNFDEKAIKKQQKPTFGKEKGDSFESKDKHSWKATAIQAGIGIVAGLFLGEKGFEKKAMAAIEGAVAITGTCELFNAAVKFFKSSKKEN
jgi:hypothetical protein